MPSVAASERGRDQTVVAYERASAAMAGLYDLDGGPRTVLAGLAVRQMKGAGTAHRRG